jgi:hypothetical protein
MARALVTSVVLLPAAELVVFGLGAGELLIFGLGDALVPGEAETLGLGDGDGDFLAATLPATGAQQAKAVMQTAMGRSL